MGTGKNFVYHSTYYTFVNVYIYQLVFNLVHHFNEGFTIVGSFIILSILTECVNNKITSIVANCLYVANMIQLNINLYLVTIIHAHSETLLYIL